jgi:hypothetical protein
MSGEFRQMPTALLRSVSKTADKTLGEEIQRVARADVGFSWALYQAMEIDAELERRGMVP